MKKRVSKRSLKERRRRAFLLTSVLWVVFVLSALVFIAVVTRIPDTKIASVSVSGATYANPHAIKVLAEGMVEGTHLFLIPRSHIAFAPLGDIREEIEKTFPSARDVEIQRTSLRSLSIAVVEEEPAALWCSETCFFMNADGYVFAETRLENDYVIYKGLLENRPVDQVYLDGAFPTLVDVVSDVSAVAGMTPSVVSVDSHGDVNLSFTNGVYVLFVLDDPRDALLEAVHSIFTSEKVLAGRRIEYADFRFGNKIFVKFEGEE